VELLAQGADLMGAKVLLYWWVLLIAVSVTLVMALLSGLIALRSLRLVEPAVLLR
jgi:putative ABC transport system permease protein